MDSGARGTGLGACEGGVARPVARGLGGRPRCCWASDRGPSFESRPDTNGLESRRGPSPAGDSQLASPASAWATKAAEQPASPTRAPGSSGISGACWPSGAIAALRLPSATSDEARRPASPPLRPSTIPRGPSTWAPRARRCACCVACACAACVSESARSIFHLATEPRQPALQPQAPTRGSETDSTPPAAVN